MLTGDSSYSPFFVALDSWLKGFGPADSWDGYFYNNAAAAGSQLYPTGLSKYFDLYSVSGITAYTFAWLWD